MKKKILIAVSAVLVAVLALGGTLAYLISSDEDVNVMVVGNVKIEQLEYERATDENGNYIATDVTDEYGYTPDDLQEFTQNKLIVPAVYDEIIWDDRNGSQAASGEGSHQQSWGEVGAPGSNQLFDADMDNVLDKMVFVKNTGTVDAYYRTVIAIECPVGFNAELLHLNVNGNARFDWEDVGYITVDGVQYILKVATYNQILTPGEVSRPSLLQVFLDKKATNEDVAKLGATLDILVVSQGVQADGFDSAEEALDEAFYDVTTDAHPWIERDLWDGTASTAWYTGDSDAYTITSAEELAGLAQLVNGGNNFNGVTVTLATDVDLQGKAWTSIGKSGASFNGTFDGAGYTVSNLSIAGEKYVGLFGATFTNATIKNVNVNGAEISGLSYVGVIVGHSYGDVTGCTVKNATLNCADATGEDGDKVGAIVGFTPSDATTVVSNNTASEVDIIANRDAGIIAGRATSKCVMEGNSWANCTVTWSGYGTGANLAEAEAGRTN